ncbi:MAG TPA: alpha/beta hydrolase [Candidatus Binatus sp.]|jgi:pimeloyl-ACP methyl ester carboxylesterase|nr:alpha/beta hydrolase [Candidatus Binatus sp.]
MASRIPLREPEDENVCIPRPRHGFRKLWFLIVLFCIVLGFGAWCIRGDLRAYAILTHFVSPQASGPLLRLLSNPITIKEVTMQTANGPVRGKLYMPVGVKDLQGMVVVHGMHRLGIDEPRLTSFARGTAEAGLAVFTPQISALADYHVDEKSVTTICEAPGWLQQRIGGGPVIVTTLSFSGGLALLAARNPDCARHIRALVLFGAYEALARVSRYLMTGQAPYPDGHVVALPAHPYGPQVFVYAHLSRFFPQDDLPAAHEALRYWLGEEPENAKPWLAKLSPAARPTMEDLFADRIEIFRTKMLDVIGMEEPELAALSPHGQIADLQVPVLILHGSTDNVIPAAESAWLAEEIPPKELRGVLITPAFSHVDPQQKATWLDEMRLVHFVGGIFRIKGGD